MTNRDAFFSSDEFDIDINDDNITDSERLRRKHLRGTCTVQSTRDSLNKLSRSGQFRKVKSFKRREMSNRYEFFNVGDQDDD